MDNNKIYVLLAGIAIILAALYYLRSVQNVENFDGTHSDTDINIHPDERLMNMLSNIKGRESEEAEECVKKSDLEKTAREVALQFCPVSPDFDVSQWTKNTEIRPPECPKTPDMRDYVLKSSIPPVQKCPPCICPKIKVDGKLCKPCPKEKLVCPAPKPCSADQCKDVVDCGPLNKACPKSKTANCPAPQPCPTQPIKICPAIKLPSAKDLKCPPCEACKPPAPCPQVERCEDKNPSKCDFTGIKEVDNTDIFEVLQEITNNKDDDNNRQKLLKLKQILDNINLDDPNQLQDLLNNRNNTIDENKQTIEEQKRQLKNLTDDLQRRMNLSKHDNRLSNMERKLDNISAMGSKLDNISDNVNNINSNTEQIEEEAELDTDLEDEINIRRNNGEETDEEEVRNSMDGPQPIDISNISRNSSCNSIPFNVKRYNNYRVVGATIV